MTIPDHKSYEEGDRINIDSKTQLEYLFNFSMILGDNSYRRLIGNLNLLNYTAIGANNFPPALEFALAHKTIEREHIHLPFPMDQEIADENYISRASLSLLRNRVIVAYFAEMPDEIRSNIILTEPQQEILNRYNQKYGEYFIENAKIMYMKKSNPKFIREFFKWYYLDRSIHPTLIDLGYVVDENKRFQYDRAIRTYLNTESPYDHGFNKLIRELLVVRLAFQEFENPEFKSLLESFNTLKEMKVKRGEKREQHFGRIKSLTNKFNQSEIELALVQTLVKSIRGETLDYKEKSMYRYAVNFFFTTGNTEQRVDRALSINLIEILNEIALVSLEQK